MKKKLLICAMTSFALCLSLAACGGGGQSEDGAIHLIMGGTNSKNNVLTLADYHIAELVEERSGGRLVIDYYPNNVLGGDRALVDSILGGSIDLANCSAPNFSQYSDDLEFLELPGLFEDLDHYNAVLASEEIMDPLYAQIEEETGLSILCARDGAGETRALFYKGDPIRVPSDANGMMFRTTGSPIEVAFYKALGISAQAVEYSESYTAMQQNMVNGIHLQPVMAVDGAFNEVAQHCTYIDETYVCHLIVASADLKEKIGQELYDILCECIDESVAWSNERWPDAVAAAHETVDATTDGIYLTEEEMDQWDELSAQVRAQYVGTTITQEQLDAIAALA